MQIKEISIGVSRTFNLGNFESFRVEASAVIAVEEDGVGVARECAIEEVRSSLNAAYLALKPKKENSNA